MENENFSWKELLERAHQKKNKKKREKDIVFEQITPSESLNQKTILFFLSFIGVAIVFVAFPGTASASTLLKEQKLLSGSKTIVLNMVPEIAKETVLPVTKELWVRTNLPTPLLVKLVHSLANKAYESKVQKLVVLTGGFLGAQTTLRFIRKALETSDELKEQEERSKRRGPSIGSFVKTIENANISLILLGIGMGWWVLKPVRNVRETAPKKPAETVPQRVGNVLETVTDSVGKIRRVYPAYWYQALLTYFWGNKVIITIITTIVGIVLTVMLRNPNESVFGTFKKIVELFNLNTKMYLDKFYKLIEIQLRNEKERAQESTKSVLEITRQRNKYQEQSANNAVRAAKYETEANGLKVTLNEKKAENNQLKIDGEVLRDACQTNLALSMDLTTSTKLLVDETYQKAAATYKGLQQIASSVNEYKNALPATTNTTYLTPLIERLDGFTKEMHDTQAKLEQSKNDIELFVQDERKGLNDVDILGAPFEKKKLDEEMPMVAQALQESIE